MTDISSQAERPWHRRLDVTISLPMAMLASYFALALIARLLRGNDLSADENQLAFLSQFMWLGYGNQPPFYNWLAWISTHAFGTSILSLSLLKDLLLFLSCLCLGVATRVATERKECAELAAIGAVTLPAVFLLSQRDLTHTVGAFLAVALFLLCLFSALKRPTALNYALVGLTAGIGFLAKYNFAVLPIAAGIALLLDKDWRARALDWRVAITVVVGLAVVAPHLNWVHDNFGMATGATVEEMQEAASGSLPKWLTAAAALLLSVVKCSAITLALFALAYRSQLADIVRAESKWTRLTGRMLLISLLLVFVVLIAVDATTVRPKWLAIYFLLLPVYLACKVAAANVRSEKATRQFTLVSAGIVMSFLVVILIGELTEPLRGKDDDNSAPYAALASQARAAVLTDATVILAENVPLAGNLKIWLPNALVVTPDTAAIVGAHPAIVVWQADKSGEQPAWTTEWMERSNLLDIHSTTDGNFRLAVRSSAP
ncbi:4-amino-4-deoxy-L-arabinose transferase [Rhizobium grahamii]|uniref:4-amino-4-deoxy-L-arabinose transferase n=1 Tax=Rhizobium grahamii TaxID=1120045 RepID=A0A5Q0C359_9HYPH|nr:MULTISPECIES: glycosyltransferase family 39 protein [Rhizobium]QFY60326.1 4-amino-4-deoxy-L-arabinose transferase [Rhizobium grahamii]QRM50547.1 4-amino-4-deoxy-L-arabinose transferase [Rhizobium sp. BG6]